MEATMILTTKLLCSCKYNKDESRTILVFGIYGVTEGENPSEARACGDTNRNKCGIAEVAYFITVYLFIF